MRERRTPIPAEEDSTIIGRRRNQNELLVSYKVASGAGEVTRGAAACVVLVLASSNGASEARSPQSLPKGEDVSFDCVLNFSKAIPWSNAREPKRNASEVNTLVSLSEVYARAGKRDKALQLMSRARQEDEAEQAHPTPPPVNPFLRPDPDARTAGFARSYLSLGAYDDAIEFARRIGKPSVRARSMIEITLNAAAAGRKEKAAGLLVEALKSADNSADGARVLGDVATAYAKLGDCEHARSLALSISDGLASIKAPALVSIASECAKAGFKEKAAQTSSEALRVAGLMKTYEDATKYEVFAQAASAQIDAGEVDRALALLAQAVVDAPRPAFDRKAGGAIADAYANAGLYEKAKEVASSIGDSSAQADALHRIARRYLSAGDAAHAAELLDQCLKITLANKDYVAITRFQWLGEIAAEYAKASRVDRANEVLVEALSGIRREKYDLPGLLISVLLAYGKAGLMPDTTAMRLIEKLCTGEAFEPTPEEKSKQRRAEAAAEVFIERWHQTLDMNVLFDELYVANAEQRQRNVKTFEGVYVFWLGSATMPVDEDIDETLMRDFVFSFWNAVYLSAEYDRAYRNPGRRFAIPPELEGQHSLFRRATPEKRISRKQVAADAERIRLGLPTYRKYLRPQIFNTATYISNLKREEDRENSFSPRFRIEPGYPYYGVPENVEVYFLRKGGFKFYFVEEKGKLKVLTLEFEL